MNQHDFPPAPWIGQGPPNGAFAEPRPNMQGRYLLKSARSARIVGWVDRALSLVPVRRSRLPKQIDRILLANWGHLGDVVTTLGAVSALRERHPGIEIGMIVASGGRAAIEKTGMVDHLHIVDHWWISRARTTRAEMRRHFRATRSQALREIRKIGYQAAIDFYPFFPPAHPLFYHARIPVRIGYASGGFSPLLTHPVAWPNARVPVAEQYRVLLNALHPDAPFPPEVLRPRRDRAKLASLPEAVAGAGRYVVLHPGAGADYKEWELDHWHMLADRVAATGPGCCIVLTGAGAREAEMTAEIAARIPSAIDMAGKVDWESFVSIIAHADMVVCPDTATGHVAGALDVPVVSIFTGTNVAEQWQPYTQQSRLLVHGVACAPCNRPGCEAMACIRETRPEQVLAAMRDLGWPFLAAD